MPVDDALTGAGWHCVCGATRLHTVYCPFCGRSSVPFVPTLYVEPGKTPRAGLTRSGKALAVVLTLVLFGGLNRLVIRTEAATATARRVQAAELDRSIAELSAFVAAEHGAPFDHPVPIDLLDDTAFRLAMLGDPTQDSSDDEADTEDAGDFGATMVGLGLANPDDDLDATSDSVLDDSVTGFYDDQAKRLVVRGRTLTPYVRLVMVHELTHAWQDQHYGLDAVRADIDSEDSYDAVTALIEGDARRVETAWRDAQSDAVRASITAYEDSFDSPSPAESTLAARSLDSLYGLPYQLGEYFVDALVDHGGNAEVDAAFAHPPVSTAQLFDPATYLHHHAPARVDPPDHAGEILDAGHLGQLGLTVVLNAERAPGHRDLRAATGWDGDAYVTWEHGAEICTALTVATTTRADRDRLAGRLAAGAFTTRKVGGTRVQAQRCAG